MMSDWLRIEDATRRYRVSRATLYRLIAEGRVTRGKRAGDIRAYVSSTDLKSATTIRATARKGRRASTPKVGRRG